MGDTMIIMMKKNEIKKKKKTNYICVQKHNTKTFVVEDSLHQYGYIHSATLLLSHFMSGQILFVTNFLYHTMLFILPFINICVRLL